MQNLRNRYGAQTVQRLTYCTVKIQQNPVALKS